MRTLVLKALRDLVAMRWRALLLVLILAGGMATLGGGFMARRTIFHTRDATWARLLLADLEVNFRAASDDELPPLGSIPGVVAVEKRFYQTGSLEVVPRGRPAGGQLPAGLRPSLPHSAPAAPPPAPTTLPTLVVYERASPDANRLEVLAGRGLDDDDPDGVVVEKSLADYYEVGVGQELVLDPDRNAHRFVVRGIARSPEFLLPTANPEMLLPGKGSLGVLFASRAALRRIFAEPLTNALLFRFAPGMEGAAEASVRERLRPLEPERTTRRQDSFACRFLEEDLKGFDVYLPIAGVLVGVVTAIVAFLAFGRLVSSQRRQIAALLALGATPRRVFAAHLTVVLAVWAGAVTLGTPLSHALNVGLASAYARAAGLPPILPVFGLDLIAAGAGAALLLATLSIVPPLLFLLRVAPSQALRGDTPPTYHRGASALAAGPVAWRYGLRNVLRRPALSAATVTLVALSGAMAAAFRANVASWERHVAREFDTLRFDAVVRYRAPLDAAQIERLLGAVRPARHEPAVHGFGLLDGRDYHFVGIPSRPSLRRLTFKEGRLFSSDSAREIIINQSSTERRRYALGDTVEVETRGRRVRLTVVGRLEDMTIGMAFVPIDTARELFGVAPGKSTASLVALSEKGAAETARRALLGREEVSWVHLVRDLRRAVEEYLHDSLLFFARTIVAIATVLSILFVFTALGMAIIEREGEYATLLSLGIPGARLGGVVVVEVLVQGLVATLLAVPLGYALARYLNHETAKAWMAIALEIEAGPFVRSLGPLLLLLPTGALPVVARLLRLDVSQALRARTLG